MWSISHPYHRQKREVHRAVDPDQLGGEVGAVLADLPGLGAVIRLAVIVLPLTTPLTCTLLPTGNCCAVLGVRVVPSWV